MSAQTDNCKPGTQPVVFGEVLFDRFPDGRAVLGGAPFNVAWHLQAFGQSPLFVSRVGDDPLGRRIRDAMIGWGMDTRALQLDSAHATGTVEVSFEHGEPHYAIKEECAYDFIDASALPKLHRAALVYHGSLSLRGAYNRRSLRQLTDSLAAPRFVDVNLRAPWWQQEAVSEMMREASWVKLNADELALLAPDEAQAADACESFRQSHRLDGVILTRGEAGAELRVAGKTFRVAPTPAEAMVDTVGAGDAFTSVFLLGLLRGWPYELTLERAQAFASAIVGVQGATVKEKSFYTRFTSLWELDGA